METAVKIPSAEKRAPKNVNARTFATGSGVTAALIAAAVLAFASVAAYVAFEGMPFGSDDGSESTVSLNSGAPQAAALAAASTADAVAADPATPTAAALAEIVAALPPGSATDSGGNGSGSPGTDPIAGGGTDTGPGPGTPEAPGAVQGTVGSVDDAAGGLGVDAPISEVTDPITKQVDDAVGGTLNNVGNAVGGGNLGDKVNGTVGGLLGG
jgi:hypothetical protein